jgi:Mn2+/Fe2+ NRAMP family transporter
MKPHQSLALPVTRSPRELVSSYACLEQQKVMGDKVNGVCANIVGWVAAVVMFTVAIGMLVTWGIKKRDSRER